MPLELWHRLGATLGAFHAAGIFHADLNAHNILIDDREDVHLIDFDRGERRRLGSWAAGNIARLARSLQKIGGPDVHSNEWRALLTGYQTPRSAPLR
jgi:tRNA A-37 threonylcarbamoyl transferase component Bud32